MKQNIWTEERIEALEEMVALGWSYRRIAAEMNARFRMTFSRNMCIGKARRLNLYVPIPNHGPRSQEAPKVRKASPKPRNPSYLRVVHPPVEEVPPAQPRNLTLDELKPDDCRFISGDSPNWTYCGHMIFKRSYCAEHFALCYTEPQPRRRYWSEAAE